MYLGGGAGFVTDGRVVSSQRVNVGESRMLGKAEARGRSEEALPQSTNQKQKYGDSSLRMCVTSLRVTGNPTGNAVRKKEQRMLDRENGKKREFLLVF